MSIGNLSSGGLTHARAMTLELLACCDDGELRRQWHPDFSPAGWHFGHLVAFEAWWLLEQRGGRVFPESLRPLFDPTATPKRTRAARLPDRGLLQSLAEEVRAQVDHRLARGDCDPAYVPLVLGHEQQHTETIATVVRFRDAARRSADRWGLPADAPPMAPRLLEVPAGEFLMGDDRGYDNERPTHPVWLDAFRIESAPVDNARWLAFMDAGGYRQRRWWSADGWAWLARARVTHPAWWRPGPDGWLLQAMGGDVALPLGHPVEGVSAYEAEAFATACGAKLPSEAQWEKAARLFADEAPQTGLACAGTRACDPSSCDFLGNVWEWTSTSFAPYPGFVASPYEGYSVPWFDGQHRVLRGGSWATGRQVARVGFRNWYQPHWRRVFAGLRLVREE